MLGVLWSSTKNTIMCRVEENKFKYLRSVPSFGYSKAFVFSFYAPFKTAKLVEHNMAHLKILVRLVAASSNLTFKESVLLTMQSVDCTKRMR